MTVKLSLEEGVNDGFTSELNNAWGGDDAVQQRGVSSFFPPLLLKKKKSYNLIG